MAELAAFALRHADAAAALTPSRTRRMSPPRVQVEQHRRPPEQPSPLRARGGAHPDARPQLDAARAELVVAGAELSPHAPAAELAPTRARGGAQPGRRAPTADGSGRGGLRERGRLSA